MLSEQYKVFCESSHVQERRDGIAPMGYCYLICGSPFEPRTHWGFGAEKDTQAFWAHGLERAATMIFIECLDPVITVVKENPGDSKFLTDFVPDWLMKIHEGMSAASKHSLPVWKRLWELKALSRLVVRAPEEADEYAIVAEIKACAKAKAHEARQHREHNPTLYLQADVFVTDESEEQKSEGVR